MADPASANNYRLGSLLAVATACLMATQEPFSSLAAMRLRPIQFICLTQFALLLSIPIMILTKASRRDFIALLKDASNYWKFAIILMIGMCGLLLYNLGLSNAHPILIAAILNLSPFWAALVALVVSKKPIPISLAIFFSCLAAAFVGAMMVAWSQTGDAASSSGDDLLKNILHGTWFYAIPIPVLSALNGTLIGKRFFKSKESAAIAVNFLVSVVVLLPIAAFISYHNGDSYVGQAPAIILMIIGTMIAAVAGRVLYQISLTVTDNDNGFVTMFFLLVPALTALISLPLSLWLPDLHFAAGPMFFFGLLVIASSLLLFSLKSWR
jgi:drug/metabolite transporter (DMT)-like permease